MPRKFFRNPKFKEEDYAYSKIQDEDRKQDEEFPIHSEGTERSEEVSETD